MVKNSASPQCEFLSKIKGIVYERDQWDKIFWVIVGSSDSVYAIPTVCPPFVCVFY